MIDFKISRYFQYLLLLSICIFVIIAVVNSCYAFMTMDDFFFLNHTNDHNVFVVIGEFTKNWMGRPVSTLLIAMPSFFGNYPQHLILRIFLILPFLIMIAAFGMLSLYRSNFELGRCILFAVLGSSLFYSGLPDISSFLYWSSASHTYHTGLAFLALGSVILIVRERVCIYSIIFLALSIGCVQINFILTPICFVVISYIYKLKLTKTWFFSFAIIMAVALFLFVYPGGRQANEFNIGLDNLQRLIENCQVIILPSLILMLFILVVLPIRDVGLRLIFAIGIFLVTYVAFGVTSIAPLSGRLASYYEAQFVLVIVLLCGPLVFERIPVLVACVVVIIQLINPQVHYLYSDMLTGANRLFSDTRVQEAYDIKYNDLTEICPQNTKTNTLIMSLSDEYFKSNYSRYYNVKITENCTFPAGRE